MAATHSPPSAAGVDAPHELLGLAPDENDPVRIVAAAAERLRSLQGSCGSEGQVRMELATLIRHARDAMLRTASRG